MKEGYVYFEIINPILLRLFDTRGDNMTLQYLNTSKKRYYQEKSLMHFT